MDGDFAPSGFENKAFDFNDIADVPLFELGKFFFANVINSDIGLNVAAAVGKDNEVCLAHITPRNNSSADGNIGVFKLFKTLFNFSVGN